MATAIAVAIGANIWPQSRFCAGAAEVSSPMYLLGILYIQVCTDVQCVIYYLSQILIAFVSLTIVATSYYLLTRVSFARFALVATLNLFRYKLHLTLPSPFYYFSLSSFPFSFSTALLSFHIFFLPSPLVFLLPLSQSPAFLRPSLITESHPPSCIMLIAGPVACSVAILYIDTRLI